MEPDLVFQALADPSRRKLLDALFKQDGQTLSQLETYLLPMTRFGCMKHLKVLEEAGLVVTRKIGREKYHYLNPVPIQQVYDRWVSKYAQPWTRTLAALKSTLEEENMSSNQSPSHIFEVFIRTSPQRLWQALTDGDLTQQYYFGSRLEATWEVGGSYRYPNPQGGTFVEGKILEIEPPHRLVTTFQPHWKVEGAEASVSISKVTWEIEREGELCKLTMTHEDLPAENPYTPGILQGWNRILSGLKTFLETGQPLFVN
jgi:uncharacterized protein YndB with AHSA1/START domain